MASDSLTTMEEKQNPYEPSKIRQEEDGNEIRKFSLVSCLVWILIAPLVVVGCAMVLFMFGCGGLIVYELSR